MARTVSKTESFVGYSVILLLMIITGGIFLEQSRFDQSVLKPGALQQELSTQPPSPFTPPQDLRHYAPHNLTNLPPAESFGPENLSDKINGKAELYFLPDLFVLSVSVLPLKTSLVLGWKHSFTIWGPRGGLTQFTVCKNGLRPRNWNWETMAMARENSLYFVHGPYYLEIVSSVAQERMAELMLSFGRNFISKTPVESNELNELALSPEKNLNRESISLIPSNGFGFEQFDSIFTAQYGVGDTELTAFLSRRKSQAEAAETGGILHLIFTKIRWH